MDISLILLYVIHEKIFQTNVFELLPNWHGINAVIRIASAQIVGESQHINNITLRDFRLSLICRLLGLRQSNKDT